MKKYEKYQRDYTIVGSGVVFASMMNEKMLEFFGEMMHEAITIIKNGVYYYFQVEGQRQTVARSFMHRLNQGEIDLEKEYIEFDKMVSDYEKFISKPSEEFLLEDILTLFKFYEDLLPVAVASFDPINVLEELDEDKRDNFLQWSKKTRCREEVIYKNGEMKFIPRYLEWFKNNYASNYEVDDLKYLVYTEIIAFIKEKKSLPSRNSLLERKDCFYVKYSPFWQIEFFSGKQAEKIILENNFFTQNSNQYENLNQLKGFSAYGGKVRGKVRLIRSVVDLKDFEEGEIIISPMTEPSYLPIMKKALAFVTNEGGILCHASIVARELQKPCIIGTKIATHVFKDGDEVEVDATNGIIRKV